MHSHRLNRVIFASQDYELMEAILRPKAWPSFKYQASKMMWYLSFLSEWRLKVETPKLNRSAFLIVRSKCHKVLVLCSPKVVMGIILKPKVVT